jgi:HAD superfamily hydrolase (TIGR01549 family)
MPATLGIGFDFDHTLGRDCGLESIAFYRLAAEMGAPIDERDPIWREQIAEVLGHFRAGAMSLEDAVAQFVAALGKGGSAGDAMRYRDICYGLVDELVTPEPGARELLAELAARGIRTAILTNGWSPLQYLKIARALKYDGTILVSDELGYAKPDATAFAKLVDVLGVEQSACWYVGDNPKGDVAGAMRAGLRGVWFDGDGIAYPSDIAPPDLRITSLLELLDALPGQRARAEKSHL